MLRSPLLPAVLCSDYGDDAIGDFLFSPLGLVGISYAILWNERKLSMVPEQSGGRMVCVLCCWRTRYNNECAGWLA